MSPAINRRTADILSEGSLPTHMAEGSLEIEKCKVNSGYIPPCFSAVVQWGLRRFRDQCPDVLLKP